MFHRHHFANVWRFYTPLGSNKVHYDLANDRREVYLLWRDIEWIEGPQRDFFEALQSDEIDDRYHVDRDLFAFYGGLLRTSVILLLSNVVSNLWISWVYTSHGSIRDW